MNDSISNERSELRLPGKVIAPGIGIGRVHFEEPIRSGSERETIAPEQCHSEVESLQRAVDMVKSGIEEHIRQAYAPAIEDLHQILYAYRVILDDRQFFNDIRNRIETRFYTAERAVREAFTAAADRLAATSDLAFQARAHDLRDVCQRLRTALIHGAPATPPTAPEEQPPVFLSGSLQVSSVMKARQAKAVGFVTTSETTVSEAAILLRASGIPALGGVAFPDGCVKEGALLVVDAVVGEVILWPRDDTLQGAQDRASALKVPKEGPATPPIEVHTEDGRAITLWANIDHPTQANLVLTQGLTGVGLFRTEFLFFDHGYVPDEDLQVRVYREVIEQLAGRPLVIRTFDLGSDQIPRGLEQIPGSNPALGMRGIRRHLRSQQQELRTQLRAILRAAVNAPVSILLPMVTHTRDVWEVRHILDEVIADLEKTGEVFNPDTKLGAMIEIPSAAFCVAEILQVADFVTIGTNDLIQYLTASDRNNEAVLHYQTPEVAGLRPMLELVMNQARALEKARDVYVCGDLASDPKGARALVDLGITTLSINPMAAQKVKKAIEAFEID